MAQKANNNINWQRDIKTFIIWNVNMAGSV